MISSETQFTQLMESIRQQNDLVNNVTKTLVTVEGAIAAATGVIWSVAPSVAGIGLKAIAICALAAIAIAACWAFIFAALSDLAWQGRFINYVKALEPTLFVDVTPKPKGKGRRATLYIFLGFSITAFWVVAIGGSNPEMVLPMRWRQQSHLSTASV